MRLAKRIPWTFSIAVVLFLTACADHSQPEVSSIPKEESPPPEAVAPQAPMAPMPPPSNSMAGRTLPESALNTSSSNPEWTVPAAWTATEGSAMRRASFTATGPAGPVDMSVTSFPGDVGGLLANLNRWRGQVQLAPLSPDTLESSIERIPLGEKEIVFSHMIGPTSATLAAIVAHDGNSWFFKLSGPSASVNAQETNFRSFIQSLRFPL